MRCKLVLVGGALEFTEFGCCWHSVLVEAVRFGETGPEYWCVGKFSCNALSK